jgi:hypothetical protein
LSGAAGQTASERHVRFRSENDEDSLFIEQPTPSAKRKRIKVEEDDAIDTVQSVEGDDEYSDLDLGSDGERELAKLADATPSQSTQQTASTSGESQALTQTLGRAAPTTPATQRTRDAVGNLPTPVSRNTLLIAAEERGAKRLKTTDGAPASPPDPFRDESSALSTRSPSVSFAELATHGSGSTGIGAGTGGENYELTEWVMAHLEGKIAAPVQDTIQEKLNRHVLQVRGIERGRDIAREAIKKKDARIADLQQKVVALENEKKAIQAMLNRVNADIRAFSESVGP